MADQATTASRHQGSVTRAHFISLLLHGITSQPACCIQVFVMPDNYPDVRAALLRRGWVENNDVSSGCFNLKWCLRTRAIDKPQLARNQMVNHFRKTSCLTTKNGLAQCVTVM